MSTELIDNVKGFLLDPIETLIAHKDESLKDALQYFVILMAIYGALVGTVLGIGTSGDLGNLSSGLALPGVDCLAMLGAAGMIVATIIAFIVFGIIGLFIGGLIFHIFVYIAGGRKDISTTLRTIIYAATPSLLFGWIPFAGLLVHLWSLALEILAIRELHEISTARAVIAAVLPLILMIILAALALTFFLFSTSTITSY